MINSPQNFFMKAALKQASRSECDGEIPIGAVLVYEEKILVQSGNKTFTLPDPTAHAELEVLREGARLLGAARLPECDLYVTLEPCPMCAQAISFARIRRLYFGAYDAKGGGVDHGPQIFNQPTCHYSPEIYGGVLEKECGKLLKNFFKRKRSFMTRELKK